MPDDISEQNRVIYQIAQHMKETSERIEKKLDNNTDKTEKILVEVTKSSERIKSLEGFSDETKDAIKNLVKSAQENKDDIIKIKIEQKGKSSSLKMAMGIVTFFLVGFALMLESEIKSYNKTLIEQQISSIKISE